MRSKIVPISNIARLSQAANALVNRAPNMPGMGLIEGPTGYGKTTACAWLTVQLNAVFVRAIAMSSPGSLLKSICEELGINRRPSNADTVKAIVQRLAETNRPLFIDEADYLVPNRKLIETLRDFHDLATVPVVLIGMEKFRHKISDLQQLTGRIAESVEFLPSTADDAILLAKHLAEVEVSPDLVRELHRTANGSVRLICIGLGKIEQIASARSLSRVTLADWPAGTNFFVGTAPGTAKKRAALAAVN